MTKADSDHRRASNAGVEGNERLTALTSALLLAFILIALATTPNLHALLYVHVFVGILLIGPLAVKLGSTGYRFARYYTGAPAYVAVLLNAAGGVTTAPAVLLGDRIKVTGVKLEGRTIVVDVLDRTAGQPLSESPSVASTKRFVVDRGALIAQ